MKYTRPISLLLALTLLLGALGLPAWAAGDSAASGSGSAANPLYPALSETADAAETMDAGDSLQDTNDYVSISEAEKLLRDKMILRTERFTLCVYAPGYAATDSDVKRLITEELLPGACSEDISTSYESGDYLMLSWKKVSWFWSTRGDGNYVLDMLPSYYTSYSQEQQFASQLSTLMDTLNLWRASDYKKYRGIYDYIINRVDYDQDGLDKLEDEDTSNDDWTIYSAYSALVKGRAVCQGYAALFYAMCRTMGLPVRIIIGTDSAGAENAWNLAYLGGVWYNLDPAGDGKASSSTRNYFLKGSASFTGYTPEAEYETAEFQAAYPISQSDYVPTAADDTPVCQFRDVATTAYYYSAVQEMADRGLFSGVNRYTFQPEGTMTRAMLVTVLWRLAGRPDATANSAFTDVKSGSYYAEAVAWAYEKGITEGIEASLFGPDNTLTREQLATFLYRYADVMGYNISASDKLRDFTDVAQASSYAVTALRWAVGAGIIKGVSETELSPGGSALRCQMAVMLNRFISYYKL